MARSLQRERQARLDIVTIPVNINIKKLFYCETFFSNVLYVD